MDLIAWDYRAIKIFITGWGVSGFFWIPLTILAMRVMAGMGVATSKAFHAPTRINRVNIWLKRFIYGGE